MALEDEDLLREILLRLSPLPSSLPRACAVCKRWQSLVTDPGFLSSFVDHHRKEGPPILGFSVKDYPEHYEVVVFHPILDPPDSVPLSIDFGHCTMLGCSHGRVLIVDRESLELVVCAPITGEQQRVPIPTEFDRGCFMGTVMCAAGDPGHVHGACHSGPFKVVLVSAYDEEKIACVYFSETGAWGNLISTVGLFQ
ncbi:uncharacterized protein [Aegilops tauschii subsp. strangulata]|uniref:F-box domain-containing protein n=1 Tax=Aegilops tauschii TaxID=37682 RepID=R7W2P7_AEGTA|nr:putative F-box protein At3g16210 [Aegilops tauschii subsp. strangulata]